MTYSKHTFSSFFPPGRLGIVITFALAHIVPRLNNRARIFIKSHLNFYIPTYYFTRLILILICTLVFPRHWNARYFREYFSNNFNLATISIILRLVRFDKFLFSCDGATISVDVGDLKLRQDYLTFHFCVFSRSA